MCGVYPLAETTPVLCAGVDDGEATGSGFEGMTSGAPGFLPLLPPRHLKRPRNAPARSGQTPAGLPVSLHSDALAFVLPNA